MSNTGTADKSIKRVLSFLAELCSKVVSKIMDARSVSIFPTKGKTPIPSLIGITGLLNSVIRAC